MPTFLLRKMGNVTYLQSWIYTPLRAASTQRSKENNGLKSAKQGIPIVEKERLMIMQESNLKKEKVYTTSYSDFEEADRALFTYIEGFYDRNQIHSSIYYLTHRSLKTWKK